MSEVADLDARGDHRGSLDVLSKAAMQGEPAAIAGLGMRLLTGFHAPYTPDKAAELLLKAAQLGSAEAAARVAVLAALGMHIPQDWNRSLGALVFAAEQGLQHARDQLRVLAEDRDLVARTTDVDEDGSREIWGELARSIDLNRWHQPTAGRNLSETPLVRYFPEFVNAEVCQWMIDRARGRLERAAVYDAVQKKQTYSETRNNMAATFDLLHSDLVSVLVQVHICANTGIPFRHLEPTTVLRYAEGEQITEHFDFVDPSAPDHQKEIAEKGQRIVTFLVYLNDDYEDGETELTRLGISHKGRRGEAMFFVNVDEQGNSDTRTAHAGRPPVNGEKWVIAQFIRNRPTF